MKTLTTFIWAGALALLAQPNQLDLRQDPPTAVQSERVSSAYTGTSGATTYYYWVVTRYPIGFIVPTAPVIVGGASALGGGNSVALGWPAMTGASSYDVLRTTTNAAPSSCTCAVVLATTGTTLTDNGGALSAWPPGGLNSAGVAQAELQINNRDAGSPYITMAVRNAQRTLNYQVGILKNGTTPSYVPPGFIQPYANQYGQLACVDGDGDSCLSNSARPSKSIYDFVYSQTGTSVSIGTVDIGDGATHPLSASFPDLAAAQVYYSFADLTWELASAALEKCKREAPSCYVPAGTYLVNKQLATGTLAVADQAKRGWVLKGESIWTTIFEVTAAIDWLVVADYNQRFSQFSIDGGGLSLSNIVFYRAANAELRSVRSHSATVAGAKVDTTFGIPTGDAGLLMVYDSFFNDNGQYGMFWPTWQADAHGPELINTQMGGNGTSGLLFKGHGCRVVNGQYHDNGQYGIELGADADVEYTRECGLFYPWLEFNTTEGGYSSAKAAGNDWTLNTVLQTVTRNAASQDIINTVHHASLLGVGSGGLKIIAGAGNRGVMAHGDAVGANGHLRAYAESDANAGLNLHPKGSGAVITWCGSGATNAARVYSSAGTLIGYVDCSANPGYFVQSTGGPLVKVQSIGGGGPGIIGTDNAYDIDLRTNNASTLLLRTDKGVQWRTGTEPACDSSTRGVVFFVAGGMGVADTYQVCTKDGADAYGWRALF